MLSRLNTGSSSDAKSQTQKSMRPFCLHCLHVRAVCFPSDDFHEKFIQCNECSFFTEDMSTVSLQSDDGIVAWLEVDSERHAWARGLLRLRDSLLQFSLPPSDSSPEPSSAVLSWSAKEVESVWTPPLESTTESDRFPVSLSFHSASPASLLYAESESDQSALLTQLQEWLTAAEPQPEPAAPSPAEEEEAAKKKSGCCCTLM